MMYGLIGKNFEWKHFSYISLQSIESLITSPNSTVPNEMP